MKIWALIFVLVSLPTWAQASAADQGTQRSAIEGRVVRDPGDVPVKKAEVQLIADDTVNEGKSFSAISDADGHFRIEGIPAGRYRAFVERSGFVEINKQHLRAAGAALTFSPGKDIADLVLHMLPAAVVVGRVVDEDGDPMPRTDVSVLRYGYRLGQRHVEIAASGTTNDLGEYRIPDLLPGRYMVAANPVPDFSTSSASSATAGTPSRQETAYVSMYYPGVTDRSQAAFLDLRAGDETSVNFNLIRVPTFHVRGSIAGALGGRGNPELMIRPKNQEAEFLAAPVDKNGSFEVSHLAPGSYTLFAVGGNPDAPQIAQQTIEVTNGDVSGIRIVALGGSRVRGSVRVEGGRGLDFSSLLVFLQPADDDKLTSFFAGGDLSVNPTLARVKGDGSFDLKDVPAGNYSVLVEGISSLPDFYLKSVKLGSTDVSNSGISVGGGGTYALDVVIGSGAAKIDGVVADGESRPMADAIVVAVPSGEHAPRLDLYEKTVADQYGRFTIAGLTPGDYRIFAFESLEEGAYFDAAFLKPYEGSSEGVHLDENAHKSLQMKIISAADNTSE